MQEINRVHYFPFEITQFVEALLMDKPPSPTDEDDISATNDCPFDALCQPVWMHIIE